MSTELTACTVAEVDPRGLLTEHITAGTSDSELRAIAAAMRGGAVLSGRNIIDLDGALEKIRDDRREEIVK
jgi:hypothetical protein